jgi:hypothetical protein
MAMDHVRIPSGWGIGRAVIMSCSMLISGILSVSVVSADTSYASKERSTIARAHMSRARTLLVEALAEFEEGKKYARPDLLLDSEDWRLRVVSLTEQLNRVIDPRPRITREGAVFRAPPRFVKREKDQLPPVTGGARSRSDYGEKERLKERQEARARLYEDKSGASESKSTEKPANQTASIDELLDYDDEQEEHDADSANNSAGKGSPDFPDEILPDVSAGMSDQSDAAAKQNQNRFSYDEPLQAPPKQGDEVFLEDEAFDDDSGETLSGKNTGIEEEEINTLPKVISDQEVESISPEVVDSRLIDDEELTRRLEKTLSER